jgi:indole-3-glycerol phosphate synthase
VEWNEWLKRKRESLRALGQLEIRNVTPALKDFTGAVTTRRGPPLAVILELAARSPEEGPLLSSTDNRAELAALADRCSVSALAVPIDPVASDGAPRDLLTVSGATGLPTISRDLVLTREQIYSARLAGADAVWLLAAAVSAAELKTFIDIATSTHMASVVEVTSLEELRSATAAGARLLCIPAFGKDGTLDLDRVQSLSPEAPPTLTLILRGPFASAEDLAAVRHRADAVWVSHPFARAQDREVFLAQLVEVAENGG